MIRVIVESPYAGDIAHNLRYLRACMRDSLLRGEAPYASHALYTQPGVLRDDLPQERRQGIQAGFEWRQAAQLTAFYTDLGESKGMVLGRADCVTRGLPYELRSIGHNWELQQAARESVSDATDPWIESMMQQLGRRV